MKKKKLGKAQWRKERNKELEKRKLGTSEDARAARKKAKLDRRALDRWTPRFPHPGTKPSRPLQMQKKDSERFEALRRENTSLVKKIAELKAQLGA